MCLECATPIEMETDSDQLAAIFLACGHPLCHLCLAASIATLNATPPPPPPPPPPGGAPPPPPPPKIF